MHSTNMEKNPSTIFIPTLKKNIIKIYQINQNPYPKKFITLNEAIHLINIHGSSESEQSRSDGVGYAPKY